MIMLDELNNDRPTFEQAKVVYTRYLMEDEP